MKCSAQLSRRALGIVLLATLALPLAGSGSDYVPSLWVAAAHALIRLSADDGTVLDEIDRTGPPPDAIAESALNGDVWALFHRELDAWSADGTSFVSVDLPSEVHTNGPHVALAVNTSGGVLWLAGHKALYRFDLSGSLLGSISLDHDPDAIAMDAYASRLWSATDGVVTAYDAAGNVTANFSLDGSEDVHGLAWSPALGGLWVLRDGELERYGADGANQLALGLDSDLDDVLANAGGTTAWVAGDHELARVDGSGLVEFELDPFQGGDEHVIALAADPADQSVWVAGKHTLVHVGADGTVLQTVDVDHSHGPIRGAALYAALAPPTLTFVEPAVGAYVNTRSPPLEFHYGDAGPGVDLSTIALTANGMLIDASCTASDGSMPTAGTADCALATDLDEGGQSLSATVKDFAGNESDPATLAFTVDTVPPVITLSSPSGRYTNQPELSVVGSVSEAGTLTIDGTAVTVAPDLSFSATVELNEGDNTLTLVATDLAGNTTTLSETVTLDTVAPGAPNLGLISVSDPMNGEINVAGQAGAVDPGVAVTVTDVTTGASVTVYADQNGGFAATLPGAHGDLIAITLTDEAGNTTQGDHDLAAGTLPPAPASVAPPFTPTGITPFVDATGFLYSDSNPIQTGVASGTITTERAAVIRGRVLDTEGNPLPGAVVTILHHPEFGETQSRIDGRFDMAVNGGGSLTVVFRRDGYTKVERTVQVAWNDYAWAPDVVLRPLAADAGTVSFGVSAPEQYVAGPTTEDDSGPRQPAVFFPAGTTATMEFSDGSTAPLATGSLRITEYTVGQRGPEAMPAKLPTYSAYTYAADFRFDEAAAQGALSVQFSQTVYVYVTNFLQAPVGTAVPSGAYDFDQAAWIASPNGLVIKILSVDDQGKAEVDVDGSGKPADSDALAQLGFTDDELEALATHYPVGTELWRVPVEHFSPYDWNWWGIEKIAGVLANDSPHTLRLPSCQEGGSCCEVSGCIVRAVNGGLGEHLPLVSTPYSVYYASERTRGGQVGSRTLVIPLTGDYDPAAFPDLEAVRLEVDIAGEHFVKDFAPGPNQTFTYAWDGLDGYGRPVIGSVKANVTVSVLSDIRYVAIHYQGTAWDGAIWGVPDVFATRTDQTETISKRFPQLTLNGDRPLSVLANGWDLGVHAVYDETTGTLYQGNGKQRSVDELPLQPSELANNLQPGAPIQSYPSGAVTTVTTSQIVSVGLDGTQIPIADVPDGAQIVDLADIGSVLYVLDAANGQIDAVRGGSLTPVVADLVEPRAFAADTEGGFLVAACGAIFSAQFYTAPVRVAGQGCNAAGDSGDGGPAREGKIDPGAIGVSSDGSVYFIQRDEENGTPSDRVRKVERDGTLATVAGGGSVDATEIQTPAAATSVAFARLNDLLVRSDGGLLLADVGHFYTENEDTLQPPKPFAQGMSAGHIALLFSGDFAVSTTDGQLWKLAPVLPTTAANSYTVAARDGRTVSVFDAYGRETGVYDAITGAELLSFQYDGGDRLVGVTDVFGRVTTIERAGNGYATAIVSPDGQTTSLTVNGNGDLTNFANPAGDAWQLAYDSGSLLAQFTDPDGHEDQYGYDSLGRLSSVQEPNGGGWSIEAPNLATAPSDSYAIMLTSGEGRTTTYNEDAGKWYCLFPGWEWSCGYTSASVQHPDGTETLSGRLYGLGWWGGPATTFTTRPDGTYMLASDYPDLRFGQQSPLHDLGVTLPSGLHSGFEETRSAVLQPGNPLAVSSYTEQFNEGSGSPPYVNHFDAASHTWTSTTPMGRTVNTTVDSLDRPVTIKAPALATVSYAYTAAGRLSGVTAGSGNDARNVSFQYYGSGPTKGFLQNVTDPLGRITGFGYDPAGRVTSETLPDGEVIGFGYDAVGNLVSVTPPARPAHGLGYDAVSDLASYTPPAASGGSGAVGYSYNRDRQLTDISLPNGNDVALQYNDGGQLTALSLPSGQFDYGYDATTGQLTGISGGADAETLEFQYDGFLPTQSAWTGPVPGTVSAAYDQFFRVTSISVDGQNIGYGYEGVSNAGGLLAQAGTLNLTRDTGNGLVTKAVLAATADSAQAVSSVYSYDDFGELASVQMISAPEQLTLTFDVSPPIATDPTLNITGTLPGASELEVCVNEVTPCDALAVDADGSVAGSVTLTQINNNSLDIMAFDATGNLIGQGESSVAYQPAAAAYAVNGLEAVGPDGTQYFSGSSTEEQGSQFVLAPGAASASAPSGLQPASQGGLTVAPDGSVYYVDGTEMLWHLTSGDTLTSLADLSAYYPSSLAAAPDGDVYFTRFGDESLYRVDPSGDVSTAGTLTDCSDLATAPTARQGGGGGIGPNIIARGYDLTVTASAEGVFVGCEGADQSSYIAHKLNADGSFTVQATSTLSQPEFAAGPGGTMCFAEHYTTTVACITPDGSETDYALEDGVFQFGLDGSGNLYYAADDSNGDLMLWQWTTDGSVALLPPPQPEPATLTVTGSVVTPPAATYDAQYTRNQAGEVTTKTETINGTGESWSYGYDDNGCLTSVTNGGGTVTYGYDANGNRVSVDGVTVATYNAQDQLMTYGGNGYTWTADGELAAKTTSAGTTQYTWNVLGETTDVALPDGTEIHYVYDGLGRRVGKEKNGSLVAGYLYAGNQIVSETDGSGNVTERFIYATRPNVPDYLIKYNGDGTSSAYRIVSDQAGSVRLVIDASTGAIAQQIDYDVWGNITSDSNPGFQPFTFAGGLYDADTGLVHFGARDYDPETGRWISRDPILFAGGDPNLYRYVIDDPVNFIDPSGRGFIAGAIGALVGAVVGGVTSAIEGGSWSDIATSAGAGFLTGGLAGLTFGASLLVEGSASSIALNVGAKSLITGAIETGRELITGNGCLSAGQILSATAFGALGDGAGAAAWRSFAPYSRTAADVWDGIFSSTVDGGMTLAIAAGQANARAASYRPRY